MFAKKLVNRNIVNAGSKTPHRHATLIPIAQHVIPVAEVIGSANGSEVITSHLSHVLDTVAKESLLSAGVCGIAAISFFAAGAAYLYATAPNKLDADTLRAYDEALKDNFLNEKSNNQVTKCVKAGGTIPELKPDAPYTTQLFHHYLKDVQHNANANATKQTENAIASYQR